MSLWHIVAFGLIFAIVIFLLIVSVSLSRRAMLSLMIQMFALLLLSAGMIEAYFLVEKQFKPVAFDKLTITHYYYVNRATVRGFIHNTGKETLDGCVIRMKGYEPPKTTIDYLYKLYKPQSVGEVALTSSLPANTFAPLEIDLNGVGYEDNISVSISVKCR